MPRTNRLVVAAIAIALSACAAQTSKQVQDKNVAIRDFVELRELESLARIRTDNRDVWERITPSYVIYKTRRADYLFEFARPCHELDDRSRIVADVRGDPGIIRARFETLRGCRIAAIYALKPEEVAELRHIGEPPGSRN